MRSSIKSKPTNLAIELILNKLEEFESDKAGNANISLKQSIENNWKGVFHPKQPNNNNSRIGF
jgi:hypothetical protein